MGGKPRVKSNKIDKRRGLRLLGGVIGVIWYGAEKERALQKLYIGNVLHDMLRMKSDMIDKRRCLSRMDGRIEVMEFGLKTGPRPAAVRWERLPQYVANEK